MNFRLDGSLALSDLKVFTAKTHPFGSPAQAVLAVWLGERLAHIGLVAETQTFAATTPKPWPDTSGGVSQVTGRNILAKAELAGAASRCLVLVASHYDTKRLIGTDYRGANDSASSSVVLLQLMSYLRASQGRLGRLPCDIMGLWLDGEEAVLPAWDDGTSRHPAKISDHTYGSQHFVGQLKPCRWNGLAASCHGGEHAQPAAVIALILLDMLGSPQLAISRDSHSSLSLSRELTLAAAELGLSAHLDRHSVAVADDHLPFRAAGIAALDIIDFNNLEHWHRASDTLDKIALPSLEKAGRLALYIVLTVASRPKDFLANAEHSS